MKYIDVFGIIHEIESSLKPITNAELLRSMTDEELAEFLLSRDLAVVGQVSKAVGFTYKFDRELCLANVLDWLRTRARNA